MEERERGGVQREEKDLCVCADKAEGPRVLEEWVNGMEMLMSILCVCVWYYVYIYVCVYLDTAARRVDVMRRTMMRLSPRCGS